MKNISARLQQARDYENKQSSSITPADRPVYHFTPRIGWMNDPNGFSYYKGKYHLFYQYYPYDIHWNDMHWGHAVSEDLIRWEYLPCALAPDKDYDEYGIFSGSAIELPDGRHLLMYTGVYGKETDDGKRSFFQNQCIAVGDGKDYEKYPANPVIEGIDLPLGGSNADFRDPKIWRADDGSYKCVIANRCEDGSGALLMYKSDDGFSWSFERVLDRCRNEIGGMWECPEFFELDGKAVVFVSPEDMKPSGLEFHNGHGSLCIIGNYDSESGFLREKIQAIDYGLDFYATQTMEAPDGRRIMIAWMQNWDTCGEPYPGQRWFSQMIFPRELHIRDGRLIQNPVSEIEALRGRRVYHKVVVSDEMSLPGVCGRVIDMTISIEPTEGAVYEKFKLKVAHGSQYYTLITYKPQTSVLSIDRRHSGSCKDFVHHRKCLVKNHGGKIKLRLLMDRFSIEIFVNDGESVLSSTIFTPQTVGGVTFESVGEQLMMEVEKYDLI